MRHGKAEAYGDDDHRRRLIARGRHEATAAGKWLAESGHLPTHALVSSAQRAIETWEHVVDGSGAVGVSLEVSDALYAAGVESALDLLQATPPDASVLAVVGHNPTVSSLVHVLDDGDPDPAAFATLSGGLPTSGVAVLEVEVPWKDLDAATAHLVACHTSHG
jgi:phosphohistidine phosphatase